MGEVSFEGNVKIVACYYYYYYCDINNLKIVQMKNNTWTFYALLLLVILLGLGCKGCNSECEGLELVDWTLPILFAPEQISGRTCAVPVQSLASGLGQNPLKYERGLANLDPSKYVLTVKVITEWSNLFNSFY